MSQYGNIEAYVTKLLEDIGENPNREGLKDTPNRVAELYSELFSGVSKDPAIELSVTYKVGYKGTVVIKDIPFYSICEHHLLPFFGFAHIGYLPNGKVAGTSKLTRALDILAKRPQIQERLTEQLADTIHQTLKPMGTAVVIEAEHLCMSMRGTQKPGTRLITSVERGEIKLDQFLVLAGIKRS